MFAQILRLLFLMQRHGTLALGKLRGRCVGLCSGCGNKIQWAWPLVCVPRLGFFLFLLRQAAESANALAALTADMSISAPASALVDASLEVTRALCRSLLDDSIAFTSGISPAEAGVPYNGNLRHTIDAHMLEWRHAVDYVQLQDMPLNMVSHSFFICSCVCYIVCLSEALALPARNVCGCASLFCALC